MAGLFLTFEGIDGSGKSTQARLLKDRLEKEGYPTLLVREPGGTALSERVREILLDRQLHIVPFAELLLFSAARAQLVEERIRPALQQEQMVIADRFYDSTTAYQGGGRRVADIPWLRAFNQRVTGGLKPHRTYLIDVPLEVAFQRLSGHIPDRMESAGKAFYERVRATYHALAREEPQRFLVLDGREPVSVLHERIWADVQELLRRYSGTGFHA